MFEMQDLGEEAPGCLQAPQLSPETLAVLGSLSQVGVPGAPGTPRVTSRAKGPDTAIPGTVAFPGQIRHAV